MRKYFAAALLAVLPAVSGPASAGAGKILTVVEPLSQTVTYNAAGRSNFLVGYRVRVASDASTRNTINNVRFSGRLAITDAQEVSAFAFSEGGKDGFACTFAAVGGSTTIDCPIGQLRAGEEYPTFWLYFTAPVKDTATPTPDGQLVNAIDPLTSLPQTFLSCVTGTDCVRFAGTTFYAEGTGGLERSVPKNSTRNWTALDVALGTASPTRVKSALSLRGGTFATGNDALTTSADNFGVRVVAPSATVSTTVELQESTLGVAGTPGECDQNRNFLTCSGVAVSIPGLDFAATNASASARYLTIVLRVDASQLRRKSYSDCNNLRIYYVPDGTTGRIQVGRCAPNPTGGIPCYDSISRVQSTTTTDPLRGDLEVVIRNTKNGRFELF